MVEQIKKQLKKQKVSQKEFASDLGVSASQVSQWFTGHRKPSKSALRAMGLLIDSYEQK